MINSPIIAVMRNNSYFRQINSIFYITLEFLRKRVRQYQEKKLDEITSKIQFHQDIKNQLEQKIKERTYDETIKIREEISFIKK